LAELKQQILAYAESRRGPPIPRRFGALYLRPGCY
jgi:hypothetical protein